MENLINFSLFGSGIAFGIAIAVLLIVLWMADRTEDGWQATTGVGIFLVLNYFWGNFPVLSFISIKSVVIYLALGFLFSLLRTYFKGKELSAEDKKYFKLKEHVFRWWFLFPVCAINWVFGKLFVDLYNLAYTKIGKIFERIFNA